MKLGDLLVLEHGWVVGERDIEVPAKCVQQEQGYQNVLSRTLPKVVGHEDQQEDRSGQRTPPTSSMFRGQIGQLQLPKVRPGVKSAEMKGV